MKKRKEKETKTRGLSVAGCMDMCCQGNGDGALQWLEDLTAHCVPGLWSSKFREQRTQETPDTCPLHCARHVPGHYPTAPSLTRVSL